MSMVQQTTLIPEVLGPQEPLPADLVALTRFATLMDEAFAIPGTSRRVGLDALIGLIPGVGDVVAALLASWIVIGAVRHRVRPRTVLLMLFNIVLDLVIGSIPVAGDAFDFLFEENVINLRLLLKHRDLRRPPRSMRESALAIAAIVGVVLLAALLVLLGGIVAAIWLIRNR